MKYIVLNEDLLEQNPLRMLNNESIQLILTSPPYFNARNYALHIDTRGTAPYRINLFKNEPNIYESYKSYLNDMRYIVSNLKRLLKPGGFIIFVVGGIISNKVHFPLSIDFFNILSDYFTWKETIIWDKTEVVNFKSHSSRRAEKYLNEPIPFNYYPNFSYEDIFIFKKPGRSNSDNIQDPMFKRGEFIENYSRGIWRIETVPPSLLKEHPARFPFEIPHNLIKYYSNRGDAVFDPFAGFGTTVIEALRLGRIGIANDKEKKFCDLMERNIKILRNKPNYFINQLNLHRIKAHIYNLKKRNYSFKRIYNFLINLNFNQALVEYALQN